MKDVENVESTDIGNWQGRLLRAVEAIATGLADEGFIVDYKIVDDYSSSTSTIPAGYSYTIKVWDTAGDYDFTLRYGVDNEYMDDSGKSTNIGNH